MDIGAYRRSLERFVLDALKYSDGTHSGISNYLWGIKVSGWLVRYRTEKQRALEDARRAFDDHRNWPVEIVLAHLGIKPEK